MEYESSMEPPRDSFGCCVVKRDELLHTSWWASSDGRSSVKWNVIINSGESFTGLCELDENGKRGSAYHAAGIVSSRFHVPTSPTMLRQ